MQKAFTMHGARRATPRRDHAALLDACRQFDELAVQAIARRHSEQTLRAIEKNMVLIGPGSDVRHRPSHQRAHICHAQHATIFVHYA